MKPEKSVISPRKEKVCATLSRVNRSRKSANVCSSLLDSQRISDFHVGRSQWKQKWR